MRILPLLITMKHNLVLALIAICVLSSQQDETTPEKQLFEVQNSNPDLNLSSPLWYMIPEIPHIPLHAIENCYDGTLNSMSIDIFKPDVSIFDVAAHYYRSLPEKKITLSSVHNLLTSMRGIVEHVLECVIKPKTYKLGLTSLSDLSADEFEKYMGFKPNTDIDLELESRNNQTHEMLASTNCYPPNDYREPSSINWAAKGIVTPIKNQGSCGSCWAFATVASIESAYLKHYNARWDLSEQQLVDCAQSFGNGCSSGTSNYAFQFIYRNGVTRESNYPYRNNYGRCWYRDPAVRIDKYCIRGLNGYGYPTFNERLTDRAIARAVAYYGPVAVCINAHRMQNYKWGVIDDSYCSKRINHLVLMVGYNENAWILKNSWGTNWGENGYFRVAKGSNTCGINFEIAYPIV